MKKITPLGPECDLAFKIIKENLLVHTQKRIEHFPNLPGHVIERIVINFQNKKYCLFLAETRNDLIIRLFDTENPEKYFVKERWVDNSPFRSNNPYVFSWRCLYHDPNKDTWCDIQLPMHRISPNLEHLVFKLVSLTKDLQLALSAIER